MILLVPVVQKVDKTLNTGSISIYWIALLISPYFYILYWIVFFLVDQRKFFFPMDQWCYPAFEQLGPAVYWLDESRPLFNSIQLFSSKVSALNVGFWSALYARLTKIDDAGAYVPVAGGVLCVAVCWTKSSWLNQMKLWFLTHLLKSLM